MKPTSLKVLLFLILVFKSGLGFTQGVVPTKVDSMFLEPYVDLDEWRESPVMHRYVHGGFKGTDTRFSFYFPAKDNYQGRFYQYITPVPDSETLSQGATGESDKIGFSIASGAYFVETNGGGNAGPTMPGMGDPSVGAYRANAASAQYSRKVAEEMYGDHRPFGYSFGGSGGAFRTIGGLENTEGVWDGAVPYVVGSPMAIPNVFSVRMHAMRVLRDKFPQIMDAIEPGGSGDMFAGLNEEQRQALTEATKMGFPPSAWYAHETMGIHAFAVLYQGMAIADSKYFEEFWTTPGYYGFDNPESFEGDRIQHVGTITKVITMVEALKMGLDIQNMPGQAKGTADAAWQSLDEKEATIPVGFQLNNKMPEVYFLGGDLIVKSGKATGKKLALRQIEGDVVVLGAADSNLIGQITTGDTVQVDNSNFLAAQTYHRHQVPGKEYSVWDQFRDATGNSIYPQRPMNLGPLFTRGASGTVQTGKFKGKMILVESLWDSEAFPWQADWYRSKVKENLGESTDDCFRVWFTDHANHADFALPGDPTHIVSYLGVLQQALRDLSLWVEKGIAPPPSTSYQVVDGQVVVPSSAIERKGIQPVVSVKTNGGERAEVSTNQLVTFLANIELPENTGEIVSLEWDFEGAGDFPISEQLSPSKSEGGILKVERTYIFSKPGIYFPTLRATSQREGDRESPYARIKNLGRVRVVVK
jgi:hypothetical protein